MRRSFIGLLLAAPLLPAAAAAEVLEVAAAQLVVLEEEEEDPQVFMRFDLSGLREGPGRFVVSAVLDWTIPGISGEERTEYVLQEVMETWDEASLQSEPPALSESTLDWDLEPRDVARIGSRVRFNVTSIVRAWAGEAETNHGIMISTGAVSAGGLRAAAGNAKLTVRYAFGGE